MIGAVEADEQIVAKVAVQQVVLIGAVVVER